jgi:DNA polymerase III delta prime subunit
MSRWLQLFNNNGRAKYFLFVIDHYSKKLFGRALNDKETINFLENYKEKYNNLLEIEEIDACINFSSDTFYNLFNMWITSIPKKKGNLRILIIWHSEFLTSSCQQMLRRQLEQRSFKNRVWFHIEEPTSLQTALISRCIVKRIPESISILKDKK